MIQPPTLPPEEVLEELIKSMTPLPRTVLVRVFPTTSSQFRDERPYTPHYLGEIVKKGVDVPEQMDCVIAFTDKDIVELDGYGLPYAYVPLTSIYATQIKPQEEK